MIKDIKYNGYSANPSDYDSPDGDLAMSLNLINEDGALKPILPPESIAKLQSGYRLLCIHKTSLFTHYVLVGVGNTIKYFNEDTPTQIISTDYSLPRDCQIYKAEPIGNIVCLLTSNGVIKLIWSSREINSTLETKYYTLNNILPNFELSFGLKGTFEKEETGWIDVPVDGGFPEYTGTFGDAIMAKANKLIADISNEGKFSMPFFVRYAYRLYDGSLINHSAPILMLPSNDGCPVSLYAFEYTTAQTGGHQGFVSVILPSMKLDVAAITDPSTLTSFGDIIKSIDIFVSAPIYSYNQSGKVSGQKLTASDNSYGIFALDCSGTSYDGDLKNTLEKYSRRNIMKSIQVMTGHTSGQMMEMPRRTKEEIRRSFEECSNFYLIKSIPIDNLSTNRTTIELEEGMLNSLVTREVMSDDYDTHNKLIAENAFSYNSRLMLTGIKKELFSGYMSVPFQETYINSYTFQQGQQLQNSDPGSRYYIRAYASSATESTTGCLNIRNVVTHFRKDGNEYVMNIDKNIFLSLPANELSCVIPYHYHPDSNAYKVEIFTSLGDIRSKVTLNLNPHDMLNGAVYFDQFAIQSIGRGTLTPTTENNTISMPNKVYVSEVNNPFLFKAKNIISVGTGEVIGLSTAAQALSQGQFGSFPLYAFATDGVWALTVSDTGAFSAVQPITRDVCINSDSITQLDGSVLFATDRGIISLAGSKVTCITDSIFTEHPFSITNDTLPHVEELHAMVHSTADKCIPIKPMLSFLKNCRMLYDYINQRVFVFNSTKDMIQQKPEYTYAYVLSLKSFSWGMVYSDLDYTIDSYPHAIAVRNDGVVVQYDGKYNPNADGTISSKTMFVTRPIKLGSADVLKSIHRIIQRGNFEGAKILNGTLSPGDVTTVLYGSRDIEHWSIVASSKSNRIDNLRGTVYKYFIIAGVAELTDGKSVSGATIEVIPRETTKLH